MDRCKHKCFDGSLVVPMRWPMDSSNSKANVQSLTEELASLSVRGESETTTYRNSSKSTTRGNVVTQTWRRK
ncbi:hypothetical protein SLA2020_339480 [Shorea laevis]